MMSTRSAGIDIAKLCSQTLHCLMTEILVPIMDINQGPPVKLHNILPDLTVGDSFETKSYI